MGVDGWPSDWLRAILPLAVLATLRPGPSYGYAIATTLADAGLGTVKGGTLYPLLARLEADGHVISSWQPGTGGPGRKYFELTASGRGELDRQRAAWQVFCRIAGTAIEGIGHATNQ